MRGMGLSSKGSFWTPFACSLIVGLMELWVWVHCREQPGHTAWPSPREGMPSWQSPSHHQCHHGCSRLPLSTLQGPVLLSKAQCSLRGPESPLPFRFLSGSCHAALPTHSQQLLSGAGRASQVCETYGKTISRVSEAAGQQDEHRGRLLCLP